MTKDFFKISVKTDHPHPLGSPDYLVPAGSIKDNHTNPYFIWEMDTWFAGRPYTVWDIGCAGGQFVVDVYNKGKPYVAVGLEGGNIYGMTKEYSVSDDGKLIAPAGAENWKKYENKCLFHADVSKPFEIIDAEQKRVMFKCVTSFEFFEHPLPEEIPVILKNINRHLNVGGRVLGTINLTSGDHHRCAKSREWWDNIFHEHGFEIPDFNNSIWPILQTPHAAGSYPYPFRSSPRTSLTGLMNIMSNDYENSPAFAVDQSVAFPDSAAVHYAFLFEKTRECE